MSAASTARMQAHLAAELLLQSAAYRASPAAAPRARGAAITSTSTTFSTSAFSCLELRRDLAGGIRAGGSPPARCRKLRPCSSRARLARQPAQEIRELARRDMRAAEQARDARIRDRHGGAAPGASTSRARSFAPAREREGRLRVRPCDGDAFSHGSGPAARAAPRADPGAPRASSRRSRVRAPSWRRQPRGPRLPCAAVARARLLVRAASALGLGDQALALGRREALAPRPLIWLRALVPATRRPARPAGGLP